jgi:hypothetical protein
MMMVDSTARLKAAQDPCIRHVVRVPSVACQTPDLAEGTPMQKNELTALTRAHLRRILRRANEIIVAEVVNVASLEDVYKNMGSADQPDYWHPALGREGHIQNLLFAGLRSSGYFTYSQVPYFSTGSSRRSVDLAVWLPDVHRWLYLELEYLGPQSGLLNVPWDAQKLIDDNPTDPRDQLRAVLAYGFGEKSTQLERFRDKYRIGLSTELKGKGFEEILIEERDLTSGPQYVRVQAGLWALGVETVA